jgi:hypothetical protein
VAAIAHAKRSSEMLRCLVCGALHSTVHLLTLVRLRLRDSIAGPAPETPTDQAIREEGERLREAFPQLISTIRRQGGTYCDEAQIYATSCPVKVQAKHGTLKFLEPDDMARERCVRGAPRQLSACRITAVSVATTARLLRGCHTATTLTDCGRLA